MSLTLTIAQTRLQQFTCAQLGVAQPLPELDEVRAALLLVREHSDYQIFGVCADTAAQAIAALHRYLSALGYPQRPQPTSDLTGAVYLKFNPKNDLCYLSPYEGSDRGVLVSCQSAYEGDINEMFGHLPLKLWD
jgi:Domain of unknown function (DUF1824)